MFEQNIIKLKQNDILFPHLDLRWIKGKKLNRYATTAGWDNQFKALINKCKKINSEFPQITNNSLRHTFATRCFEGNVSLKATQTWSGHTSAAITQYYQHLTGENLKME